MGYSTYEVDIKTALNDIKDGKVVSASDLSYLSCNEWYGLFRHLLKTRIKKVEKIDGKRTYIFTLHNNNFVKVAY